MFLKKEKGRIWKWIGLFFGAMILFTLLSRAVYQHGTAVVTTASPSSGTINHTVQITGKTVQNQEVAVTTIGGLRIASICVNEGQQVKKDDVLFVLDLAYLEETILKQEQDMKKQQLSVQDAWNQNSQAQKQKANQQAQAEENYDSAVSQAETAVERAERDLERAKTALKSFYNGVSNDKAEEEALLLACQGSKADYDSAQSALSQLQQEIEHAVQNAITQAESELQQATVVQEETTVPEETLSAEGSVPDIVEPVTVEEPVPLATELTQAQKDEIEASVRVSYADRLSVAQTAVQQAQQAVTDAEAELEAFRQRQSSGTVLSEQDLLDAVEQAQEVYDDAVAALEATKTTYGRAVSSANLPASTSNSAQIGQITYEQMKTELERLEALKEAEGKIFSPTDGIVTKCNVQTGEKTTDTTAILLADLSQGCKFSGLATEEESQYIGVGDLVMLQTSSGKLYKDLPVTTFSTTEESGGYRLTVQIPAGNLTLGANVNLSFTKKSQVYSCCVPLSALRLDNRNQAYVLVVQEGTSVMGAELQAKKVNVTVLEQNETMAALAEGALGAKDKVIIGYDKAVDSGSRVRVE